MLLDNIEHENLQVRTYINGTLYSLLTRPQIKEQARAYGLGDMLKHMIANVDEQIGRQLNYIMTQLDTEQTEDCVSDDNEEALDFEDAENYETDDEEDVDADIINAGVPTGEQLLQEFSDQIIPGDSTVTDQSCIPTPSRGVRKSSSVSTSMNPDVTGRRSTKPALGNALAAEGPADSH